MGRDRDELGLGPSWRGSPEVEAFARAHEPAVRGWLGAMKAEGNDWWQSARHAAFCLVSYQEAEAEGAGRSPDWEQFDVEDMVTAARSLALPAKRQWLQGPAWPWRLGEE